MNANVNDIYQSISGDLLIASQNNVKIKSDGSGELFVVGNHRSTALNRFKPV
jgi:hypothetical protein